ncbi:EAL domain-containing protein [Silvibacterium acidisoli]|uniref:EAL domain-containing protein n=1 Tax=Acidobacteriaceae bacterium ZG23-2 TaxID=2883246 RepID=UPI00406BE955
MANYLVTGAAGFIGSSLVRALVARGDKVRCFDNLSTGSIGNLTDLVDRIELRFGDMRQQEDVEDACKGIDYVFHQAAIASAEQSIQDPLGTLDVNLTGTGRLIEAARKHDVRRIVFAGSSAVYGNQPALPLKENYSPHPLSPFAIHKLASEQMLSSAFILHGLETVTLRYFNVFGPRQNSSSPHSGVIARFVSQMLECGGAEQLTILGSGEQSRDFVYIDDVVAANLAAMHAPADRVAGRSFNIGSGQSHSIDETFRNIARLTGYQSCAVKVPALADEASSSLSDITAANEAFGYKPAVPFEEGLKRTVEWYRSTALPSFVVDKKAAAITSEALSSPPALLRALRAAIPRDELTLVYQPIVALRSGEVSGVEALLRWKHSDTLVPPAHFIPIAEQSNVILPLGQWVVDHACEQAASLRKAFGKDIRLAVNVTPQQIDTEDFVQTVKTALKNGGLPPDCMEIEITERVLMKDCHTTKKNLRELRHIGVGISIDDFGTGYSNMHYLLRYPINRIKLDKFFVNMSKHRARVLEAMTAFAREVCIPLLAEGVESANEWKRVQQAGCDEAQGYFIARPMPYDDLMRFICRQKSTSQPSFTTDACN